ncbi:MAG: hypothetical protein Ct9H300mP8_09570 [Gammaproteobacteria bacterium]|nr:MAG: hypothetical protein Ct9H300mP8_09570 [Gammaproteobacteria bacterium]
MDNIRAAKEAGANMFVAGSAIFGSPITAKLSLLCAALLTPKRLPSVYQAYLFDLDGTLVDTAPDLSTALNYALQKIGHPGVNEAETRQWVGRRKGDDRKSTEARSRAYQREPLACIHQLFLDHYATHIADKSPPYPNAVKTLKRVRAGGSKLGVVTNKAIHLTRILLDQMDLEQYFDVVVGVIRCRFANRARTGSLRL